MRRGDVTDSFGKYELIDRIGKGGMAEVFLARSVGAEGLEKRLVIKRILPELATNQRFIEMFISEAKIAIGLNHPNIVQMYDFGKVDGDYYLAMEYIDGVELAALLQASKEVDEALAIGDAVYLAMEVARGLDYAHRRKDSYGRDLGLVHRDISPENLMVSWDGTVKIVDFGIARASSATDEESEELKGKYQYMSPEQAGGRPVDHRSDIFSLGVVLFEMVCQRPLFRGDTPDEALSLVTSAVVPDLLSINPEIPEPLEHVIYKALALRPEERFHSARELQGELTRVLYGLDEIHDAMTVADHLQTISDKLPEASLEALASSPEDKDRRERKTVTTGGDATPTEEIEVDERAITPATREMDAMSRSDIAPRRGTTPRSASGGDARPTEGGISRHRKEVVIITGRVSGLVDEDDEDIDGQLTGEYRHLLESIAYKNDAVVHHVDSRKFILLLGIPISDEGDAERAARIAFDLEDAIAGMGYTRTEPLAVTIGIAIGEVVLEEIDGEENRHYLWSFEGPILSDVLSLCDRVEEGQIAAGADLYRRIRRSFRCQNIVTGGDEELRGLEESSVVQDGIYRVDGLKSVSDQVRELRRSYESFYGREIQRRLLRGTFRRTLLEERARGVVFVGRAGVGKSTLMEHFLSELSSRNVRVVRGVASPFDRDVPLASAAALCAGVLQIDPGQGVEATRRQLGQRLVELFDDASEAQRQRLLESLHRLFAVSTREAGQEQLSGRERRKRLFTTLQRIINRVGRRKPLVLAIDDVHHIDPVMLAFTIEYFNQPQHSPVFFVGTSREGGPHIDSRSWKALVEARYLKVERLGELSSVEAEQMVRGLLESHDNVDESVVQSVLERSGGNPLYLKEVVEELATLGGEDAQAGADVRETLLPPNVEGLIRARFERMETELRQTVQRVALFSSPFTEEQAGAVIEGPTRQSLERLVEEGILERTGSDDRCYRFVTGVARESAERSLVAEEAQRLHGQIAEHLLTERERHDAALIARHLEEAGQNRRALELYEEAIEEAFEEFGVEQCLRLCDRVLDHQELDDERRFRVLLWREAALNEIGEVKAARETLTKLEDLAPEVADEEELAKVAIRRSRYHFSDGDFELARRSVRRSLEIAENSGDRLGMARAWRMESVIELAEGNRARALALVDRAIASLNVGADGRQKEAMVEMYSTRGIILRQSGRHREALEAYETALAAAAGLGSTSLTRRLLLNSGLALVYTGQFSEAKRRYLRVLRECRNLGHRRQEALILVNLGHLFQLLGCHHQAQDSLRRGIELAKQVDSETALADGLITMGFSCLDQKQRQEARQYFEQGLAKAKGIPHTYLVVCALLGQVQLGLDEQDEGDELLSLAHRALRKCEDSGMMWGVAVGNSLLGQVLDRRGQRQEALSRSRRAVEMLDEIEILGIEQLLIDHVDLLGEEEQFSEERRRCIERAAKIYCHRRDNIDDPSDRRAYEDRALSRKIAALAEESEGEG